MKQRFSTNWNKSRQPRKQRKYIANAPIYIKRKMLSATLSKELRKKLGRRSIEARKNDEVKILRGEFAGRQGKIVGINKRKMKLAVENIQKTKKDGTKVNVWIHASKLMIINLYGDDKKRSKKTPGIINDKKLNESFKDKEPEAKKNVHNKK